jgi:hypothetical protein
MSRVREGVLKAKESRKCAQLFLRGVRLNAPTTLVLSTLFGRETTGYEREALVETISGVSSSPNARTEASKRSLMTASSSVKLRV